MSAIAMSIPERRFLGFCDRIDDYLLPLSGGCEVFGFTTGDFSVVDIITAIARKMKRPALVMSTWTAAKSDMDHVHAFLGNDLISEARWIVDRSFQNRQPDLCAALRTKFGDDAIRVQKVHSKFALIQDAERGISLQTSGNLNRNIRIENVCVSACPVFFGAYSRLVQQIFETQMPGAGFESDANVTKSFRAVTRARKRKSMVTTPWATQ